MSDRHLRVLRDAARLAARKAREDDGRPAPTPRDADEHGTNLRRLATRARRRLDAASRRRLPNGE